MTFDVHDELVGAGVDPGTIVRLDVPATHRHVRYLDLMSAAGELLLPDAVVESAGQPFAYVVRRERLGDIAKNDSFLSLIRILACRSDARHLCVITPGVMDVYPLLLSRSLPDAIVDEGSRSAPTWLALLTGAVSEPVSARKRSARADGQWLEHLLFKLLADAAKGIQKSSPQLRVEQTLALVGRALFFRFLVDRQIIGSSDLGAICPGADSLADVFSSPQHLLATSHWLDQTFNGDLLTFGEEGAHGLIACCGPGIAETCWHLSNIQHNAVVGQTELDWSGIHFRHVPVDVLSQVYEDFAHAFVPALAKQTSVHFTPRDLAEILVEGVFSAVQSCPPHQAKVIDPSVGGGVFLVLALRRLVAEHWKHHGQRPDRACIRTMLNTQLTGLDINRDALNVSALSLYLAALELDPEPSPLSELKFDKLLGSVLIAVDPTSLAVAHDSALGSLSRQVRDQFDGQFDIVVGNPPWTGWKGDEAQRLERCIDELTDRPGSAGNPTTKAKARYGSPDAAFLLSARGWAKPDGAIGFVLHARLIFQPASMALRQVVFETIRVTGVMNFSALRQGKWLWPTNDAPFILLTGRNQRPASGDEFYFISPWRERALEHNRQFRIDPAAALPVSLATARTVPYAFKALYKGSHLGFELIRRIRSVSPLTVNDALHQHGLGFASGYQLGRPESQVQDARAMIGLHEASLDMRFQVPVDAPAFHFEKVQWRRSVDIYRGPLLLFRESPKLDRDVRGALYAASSTAYREHYLGISFHEKAGIDYLRDFLFVLSYSDLILYYQLLTSPKFGVERDSALQSDFENFPLVDMQLLRENHDRMAMVASAIQRGERPWGQLDALIAELYDLSSADQQLIDDTLATELPFTGTRASAESPVSEKTVEAFVDAFNEIVAAFGDSRAVPLASVMSDAAGWRFFRIADAEQASEPLEDLTSFAALSSVASSYWVSSIQMRLTQQSHLHGRLDQGRYWTRTEARLAAVDWIRRTQEMHP